MPGVGGRAKTETSMMRHRVKVEKIESETKDASHQPIVTWATRFLSEPAKFEQVSGGEFLRGRQVHAEAKAVFTVNYRDGYSVRDRVVFKGENYGIVRVHVPMGVERFVELECKQA